MVAVVDKVVAVAVVAVVSKDAASVQCWRCQNAGFFEEARVCFLGALVYRKKKGYIISHCQGRIL